MLKRFFGSEATWSLNNPLKGWTRHGLSERETRLLLQTMSLAERRVSWIWQSTWPEWRHLEHPDCAFLGEELPNAETGAPPVPTTNQSTDEITAVQMAAAKKRAWGREHERAMVGLKADIILGGQTFSTTTENVSHGGLKFVDLLPEWVAGYFTVVLSVPEEGALELTCMLVEDQKTDKRRVALVETEDEESHLPRYQAWVKGLV